MLNQQTYTRKNKTVAPTIWINTIIFNENISDCEKKTIYIKKNTLHFILLLKYIIRLNLKSLNNVMKHSFKTQSYFA